ncbi:MAG: TolC family protein [Terriglobales bacterium]
MIKRGFILVLVALVSAASVAADGPAGSKVTAQVVNDKAAPAADQGVLTLDDVVRTALAKNPAVQSAAHTTAAQRAKVPQASALPDPNVGIGWMGNIQPFSVQTGDPSSYRSVSAMQMLPFPGKRSLRGQIASKEADASQWDVEAVRRRVAADVKTAFYDYWYYDKAIRTTQQNRDLLTKLSQIAEARYRVGKGMQADVLRSQVEIAMLLQKLTVLEQQRATAQARLNTLMARDPDAPLPPAADVANQSPLNYSLDDLYKLARQNDPEYQRMQKMVERNQLAINLAHKDYLPDLSVGYMYEQRPLMPDMHGLTFTVNIPVFYKSKQREEVRQAKEEQLSASSARDNRQNELYFDLKQNYLAAKASDNLLKLFSQGVVPQSSLALESSMSAYQVGNVDFLTVIGNFTTVLNYETEYYRELANYQTALARMEALTTADLISAQPAPTTSAPQWPDRK